MTAKKRSDNVDRGAIKAFNTVKEDLNEEEECKGEEDELINKRRRDHTLKDNIELFESDDDNNNNVASASQNNGNESKKKSKEQEGDLNNSQEEDVLNSFHIR